MCMRECVYALIGGYVSMICGSVFINNIRVTNICISICRSMRGEKKRKDKDGYNYNTTNLRYNTLTNKNKN
jgi:hypothetical protein